MGEGFEYDTSWEQIDVENTRLLPHLRSTINRLTRTQQQNESAKFDLQIKMKRRIVKIMMIVKEKKSIWIWERIQILAK